MEEQQQGEETLRPERAIVYGRYTSHDGLRGWIQAKSTSARLYGDGAIERRGDDLLVRGWQRSWLGVAERVELVIPLDDISDAVVDECAVRFVWGRRARQFQFHAESTEDARRLFDCLPATRSDRFEHWAALSTLNDRIDSVGNQPWVTAALVVLNLVVFIAWFATLSFAGPMQGVELQNLGANYGPAVLNGEWWRLLTSLFLHGSVPHVLVNMWVLWNVGRLCERIYGSAPFALIYLGSGILACLARIAWDPSLPSIGASGAIFGVIGAFLAFAWRSQQQILVTVPRTTWASTLVFAVYSLLSGWLNPVVDNAAHVGGLLGGLILGWIMTRPLDVEARKSPPVRRSAVALLVIVCSVSAIWWQFGGSGGNVTAVERYNHRHQWYFTGEVHNLQTWENLGSGALHSVELASAYERQVLPFWNQAAKRLQAEQPALPADQRAANALLTKVVSLRQQWVRALIAAARDPSTYDQSAITLLRTDVNRTVARLERLNVLAQVSHRQGSLVNSPLLHSINSQMHRHEPAACVESPFAGIRVPGPDEPASDGPQARHAVACRAQSLFLAGRYRELDDYINRASRSLGDLSDGDSTLAGIFQGLDRLFEYGSLDLLTLLGRTSDWRHAVPLSVNPVLAESMIFDDSAWAVRGHGAASTVSAQAWQVFAFRVEMAGASLEEIQDRARANPVWYAQALDIGLDQARPVAELRGLFDRGVAAAPAYAPLYRGMLRILMPRWSGSHEEISSFIETVTDRPIEPDFILYARLYWAYSSLEDDEISVFDDGLAHWAIVETGFDRLVDRYPKSDFILNAYAKFACIANDRAKYQELRPKLEGRFSSTAWSEAVSLKSCDSR